MCSDYLSQAGFSNGRQWSELTTDGGPVEWSIDANQGHIQGPLDLEFLRGKKLSLTLKEGQQALLVQDNQLKAVYLNGVHFLEIGQGSRQVSPSCQLLFLAMTESLQLRWSRAKPLRWGPETHQTLIGSCTLDIGWPSRFFGTFLQGQSSPDPGFIERLIDQMVCVLFAELLSADPDTGAARSDSEVQARLTRLSPADLNEELHACGLSCTHLTAYTSAPPIEDAVTSDNQADPAAIH